MFSRFTEKAIQSIMLAQEEAKKFHHSYVGTEHILLGILGEGDNVVVKSLQAMGFTTEKIRQAVEERLEQGGLTSDYGNIPFTQQAKQVLTYAWDEARKLGHNYVNVEHLFLSIFRDTSNIAARVLTDMGINLNTFKDNLFKLLGNRVAQPKKQMSAVQTPTLDLFGRDLTWLASENKLDPVIGRHREIIRVIEILCRRSKNNPVLTGEPGVGKTALVEGLAQHIVSNAVPERLKDKRVIMLDLGLLVAGTKYRGEFEDRVKKVMEECRAAKNIILFIDELHTIIGTGGSEGSLDAANLLKPPLARGELQCIGATTLDEYRKHIEGDGALERRFQSVLVEEPSGEDTLEILRGIKSRYEEFHDVHITDEALQEAVTLAKRYITDRFLPDKAVDLIDESAAKIMLKESKLPDELRKIQGERVSVRSDILKATGEKDSAMLALLSKKEEQLVAQLNAFSPEDVVVSEKVVTGTTIADTVASWTGIPIKTLTQEESKRLLQMEAELKETIIGQDEAIESLSRAVKRSKVGLKDPKRPAGSFLFLGPTGVGKSELAKSLARFLFGTEDALIRIDMSEYMEKHSVSRLVGSPPGYVGYNEGGQLTEPVRRKPYSVVLFDELEKASPDITNVLLQILDDGRITDSTGRTVDFKNTIIIMTSNVGSKFIHKETEFGFSKQDSKDHKKYETIKQKIRAELQQEFRPEFLNRIDDIVIFKSLTKETMRGVLDILLHQLQTRFDERNIRLSVSDDVKVYIVEKGFDDKLGARPLKRALQEHFEDKLADKLLKENIRGDIRVRATLRKGDIAFSVRKIAPKKVKKNAVGAVLSPLSLPKKSNPPKQRALTTGVG